VPVAQLMQQQVVSVKAFYHSPDFVQNKYREAF